jgi:hypothetical protein
VCLRLACLRLLLLLALLSGAVAPSGAADESILHFHSFLIIHPDATLEVTETIRVQAAGREIRRGIVREFPTRYRDRFGNPVTVDFDLREVRRDGRPEPYHLKSVANGVHVYIGHKEVFLPPGTYTYTLRYRTARQLGFFQDFDELYWNVTGHGWVFPILAAEAVVQLPPGARMLQAAAWTGPYGSKEQAWRLSRDAAGRPVFTTTRPLAPQEGFTIAVAWPKGLVTPPSPAHRARFFLRDHLSTLAGGAGFLVLLGYYVFIWRRVGRDPQPGPIIPLFSPPAGFSPAAVRVLTRMGFDDRALAAAVVDLAVKGHLLIRQENGTYQLIRRPGPTEVPRAEARFLSRLFAQGNEVPLGEAHQPQLREARETLADTLNRELHRVYFHTNYPYLLPGGLLTLLIVAAMVLASPSGWEAALPALWLTGWSAACFFFGYQVWQAWRRFRGSRRVGTFLAALGRTLFFLPFFAFLFLGLFFLAQSLSALGALLFASLAGTNALFAHLLKAPTLQGRRLLDQIEGFRMFLAVAERERLEVLHPPDKTPELFEKYLPYALALEVENEWAAQFTEVLAAAQVEGRPYQPGWYVGRDWDPGRISGFAGNLGSSFAAAIASAATPPGSSSGSGGGGFSGGGGGGGGGRGW